MKILVLLLIGWVGVVTAALAQAPAAAVDTATYYPQRPLRNLGGTLLPRSGRLLLLEARYPKTADTTYLRQRWYDQHLHPERPFELALPGRKQYPEQVQPFAGSRVLVRLAGRDSLRLLALDSAGRVLGRAREALPQPRRDYDQLLPELPELPGVLSLHHARTDTLSVLTYYDAHLRVRWQRRLRLPGQGLRLPLAPSLRVVADSTHLWLLTQQYPTRRRPVTTAVCLRLADGAELGRRQLAPTPAAGQLLVSTLHLNPDHSLWLAGHAYQGQALNTHHSGDFFGLRLSPAGQRLDSVQLPLRRLPQQLHARGRRVAWQALYPEPGGGLRLVGETYTTTPAAASFVRTVFSIGLLGFDVLRPKDLLTLHLTPAGQVEQPRLVPLPADHGSFVWPFYESPLAMEQMADLAHGFRTRGLAADSQTLVLRSRQRVQALNLRTGQTQLLRPTPAGGNLDVLYTGPDYVLLAEARSLRGGIRLVRLPLAGAH